MVSKKITITNSIKVSREISNITSYISISRWVLKSPQKCMKYFVNGPFGRVSTESYLPCSKF